MAGNAWIRVKDDAGVLSLLLGLIISLVVIGVEIGGVLGTIKTHGEQITGLVSIQAKNATAIERICVRLQIACDPNIPPSYLQNYPSTAAAPIPPMPRPRSRSDNPLVGTNFAKSTPPPEDTVIPQEFERRIR